MSREDVNEEFVEKEIDVSKVYRFPSELSVEAIDDSWLVIYTRGCSWLVFDEAELQVFQALQKGSSIEECLLHYDEELVAGVIAQIEAKHFECPRENGSGEKRIYIMLTNRCNEHCRHCYMYSGDRYIDELSVTEWKEILKDFKKHGGMGVTFTGGEATIYEGFDDIVRYAHEEGLHVAVLTNGIMWDEKRVKELSGAIDEVQISMDGYDSESYFAVRQYDGFEKALKTVQLFDAANVRTSVAVTPLYDRLDSFIAGFQVFAKKFRQEFPNVYIRLSYELLPGRDLQINDEKNREYTRKMKSLVESIYPGYYIRTFVLNYAEDCCKRNCGFGEISLAPNGDVYWCNRIHELSSSCNVRNIGVKEVLNRAEQIKKLTDVDHVVPCAQCSIRYVCGGACRMKYQGIQNVEVDGTRLLFHCTDEYKKNVMKRMVESNEFFYEE